MNHSIQRVFKIALVALTAGFLAPAGRAELPPFVYKELKEKAPEVIQVEITRVARSTRDDKDLRHVSIYADATVTGITRTTRGLKLGDKISLRYMTFEVLAQGWAGPRPIDQVQTGKRYNAWLKRAGSNFFPAARGQSFQPVR